MITGGVGFILLTAVATVWRALNESGEHNSRLIGQHCIATDVAQLAYRILRVLQT